MVQTECAAIAQSMAVEHGPQTAPVAVGAKPTAPHQRFVCARLARRCAVATGLWRCDLCLPPYDRLGTRHGPANAAPTAAWSVRSPTGRWSLRAPWHAAYPRRVWRSAQTTAPPTTIVAIAQPFEQRWDL